MHPWELWQYTYEEYIWKRKGRQNKRMSRMKDLWLLFRYHAFFTLAPYLKKKHKIDDVVPDIFAPVKEKPKKSYAEIIERYKKAGALQ